MHKQTPWAIACGVCSLHVEPLVGVERCVGADAVESQSGRFIEYLPLVRQVVDGKSYHVFYAALHITDGIIGKAQEPKRGGFAIHF